MSDSDLRQALLGTWRLIDCQENVAGTVVKPFGDNPQGYLTYTPDAHLFVMFGARERPDLFGPTPSTGRPRGPALRETTAANTVIGFNGYCGTFDVHDGQAIHHQLFHFVQSNEGRDEARFVVLDGDRLTLGTPRGRQFDWQRVH